MSVPIDRTKIDWFPTIDDEKCIGCGECFHFCKNGVFAWDEANNRPRVVHPYQCVLGCSACANLCAQGAIRFPTKQELRDMIAKAREKEFY